MATSDDFRKVACPRCGAKPAQVCKGVRRGVVGKNSVRPHVERMEAYLRNIPEPKDDAALMAEWAKVTDPREALRMICEQENFLGYDPYYKDLRNALLDMAERCSVESSSVVEQGAVNALVAGSKPASPATPDDYRGFEQDKIASNPKLQLAWDLSQIIDDGAPIGWWKHVGTASCLLGGYEMKRKGWS